MSKNKFAVQVLFKFTVWINRVAVRFLCYTSIIYTSNLVVLRVTDSLITFILLWKLHFDYFTDSMQFSILRINTFVDSIEV